MTGSDDVLGHNAVRQPTNQSFSEREELPTAADPNTVTMRFSADLRRALNLVMVAMALTEELLKLHAQRSRPLY